MSSLYKRFKENIDEQGLVEAGSRIVIGVSGGADSVCLLLLFYELSKEKDISLRVVHIDHQLRGEAACADMRFVAELCKSLGVEFLSYKEDVSAFAEQNGLSTEEAGRVIRYKRFAETAEGDRTVVAVAHNMDDNAETFLHNLVRGADLKGLAGMKQSTVMNGVRLVRPLLIFERKEIEEYLAERGQAYRTDQTNEETDYTRNKIRHLVLKELRAINPKAIRHIDAAAGGIGEADEYLNKEAEKLYERAVCENEVGLYLDAEALLKAEAAVCRRVVYGAVVNEAGSAKDITNTHIEDILSLVGSQSGKRIYLPYGLLAVSEGARVVLKHREEKKEALGGMTIDIDPEVGSPKKFPLPDGREISFEIIEITDDNFKDCVEKKLYNKVFDYDKIAGSLFMGTRDQGDVITLQNGRKLLNRYMIDSKIPRDDRDSIPILKDDSEVIWIVGHRISEKYKLTKESRRGLRVIVSGEDNE